MKKACREGCHLGKKLSFFSFLVISSFPNSCTHLDFGGSEAGTAVYSLQSDGVKLAFVEVNHRQLAGFVRTSRGGSQGELEFTPESFRWGAGVGAGVYRAGLILGEGIAVGESLKPTQKQQM